ncbi:hypothetical protein OCV99_10680 [Dorea acetigenes]|uniref:Uncharacterized protein n=1 Tax=Dorea acetigenes TaxID=2981787 RepID=A0ABT2RNN4_9FIRM|nr:hypothetical protein [Dorea acetigenes]MCU6687007.1 hypothetical protein [Dorea acetigenes]
MRKVNIRSQSNGDSRECSIVKVMTEGVKPEDEIKDNQYKKNYRL